MAVRKESVLLELVDHFTTETLDAARAAKTLDLALDDLDGSTVRQTQSTEKASKAAKEYTLATAVADEKARRFKASLVEQARAALDAESGVNALTGDTDRLSNAAVRGSSSIDRLSGRLRIWADIAAILGPSIAPIAAIGIPAVTGLASQFAFAAIAGGTMLIAFQGIGDTLKAVNAAALEPTTANLEKARDAMRSLSPAGRDLVTELAAMKPLLTALRDTAQEGLFPGLVDGFESLEDLAPRVNGLLGVVSDTVGDLFAEGAESLAGDRWADFFTMLEIEARPVLTDTASALGSVIHGLSEMWEAFAPLNRDFGSWLADSAGDFDKWAEGLSQTEGFEEFIDYIRTNGPKVADAAAAVGGALVEITEAVAPLGGPSLKIIETFANLLGGIADSDLGTPIFGAIAALAILNRSLALTATLQTRMMAGPLFAGRVGLVKSAAAISGLAVASTGAADGIGLTNTMSLALMGTIAGPWGTAIGAGVGLMLDAQAAAGEWEDAQKRAQAALDSGNVEAMNTSLGEYEDHLAGLKDLESTSGVGDFFADLRDRNPFSGNFWGADLDANIAKAKADLTNLQNLADGKGFNLLERSGALEAFDDPYEKLRAGAHLTAAEIRGLTDAMRENRNVALGAFDAVTQYREALKSARIQGRKNNEGIEGNSKAALENRHVLSELAGAWNNQSAAVRNNVSKFREAKDQFIKTAVAMGVPIDKAKELARELLAIPRSHVTKVSVDDGDSLAVVHGVISALSSVHDKVVHITTVFDRNNINLGDRQLSADGGTVPDDGGPYSDRFPYLLAPRERITSDRYGQATKSQGLLDMIQSGQINDRNLTALGNRRSERPVGAGSRHGGTVRHLFEFRVVDGELDLSKAKAQIGGMVREIGRDEIDQDYAFAESQR